MTIFKKDALIEITRKAHAYTHMGYTDPNTIIPEEVIVMRVKAARMTKNGLKVHFRDETNAGFAIDVEKTTLHTFRVIGT